MTCCLAPSSSKSLASSCSSGPCFPGLLCRNVSYSVIPQALSKHYPRNRVKEKNIRLSSEEKNAASLPFSDSKMRQILKAVEATPSNKATKKTAKITKESKDLSSSHLDCGTDASCGEKPDPKESKSRCDDDDDDDDDDDNDLLKKYKCHLCTSRFDRPWRLKAHVEQHSKTLSFKCDYDGCNKAYSYKQHLDRHKSISHADAIISVSKIMCPATGCGAVLASSLTLKKHIYRHHDESNFKFPCSVCGKKFKKHRQLSLHLMDHTNEPPFRCEVCGAGSVTDSALKKHMKSHKEYACTIPGCTLIFGNFSLLRKHKSEHKTCFSTMKCAHCDKTFKNRSSLVEHVMTHLNKESTIFRCSYEGCSRVYYQKRNLNHHVRFFHERKTRFMCPWEGCGRPCHNQKKLDLHLNVHQNGKAPRKASEKPRAKRKDAGQKKRAAAVLLSGFSVSRTMEKELLSVKEEAASETLDMNEEDEIYMKLYEDTDAAVDPLDVSSMKEKELIPEEACENEVESMIRNVPSKIESSSEENEEASKAHENENDVDVLESTHHLPNIKEMGGKDSTLESNYSVKIYVADAEGCVNNIEVDVENIKILDLFKMPQTSFVTDGLSCQSTMGAKDYIRTGNVCDILHGQSADNSKGTDVQAERSLTDIAISDSFGVSTQVNEAGSCAMKSNTMDSSMTLSEHDKMLNRGKSLDSLHLQTLSSDIQISSSIALPAMSTHTFTDTSTSMSLSSNYFEPLSSQTIYDKTVQNTGVGLLYVVTSSTSKESNDIVQVNGKIPVSESSLSEWSESSPINTSADRARSMMLILNSKEENVMNHLEHEEELKGPSKDNDSEDGSMSEGNSGNSEGDDSGSDDDVEYFPEDENDDSLSGEEAEDDGEGGDEDQEEDEEEDDEQDEVADEEEDDDEEDDDEGDDENGGANQGEQNDNDDNNNSDNANHCDSVNDSDRQMEPNLHDKALNIGDGSETGLDRSLGNNEDNRIDVSNKGEPIHAEIDILPSPRYLSKTRLSPGGRPVGEGSFPSSGHPTKRISLEPKNPKKAHNNKNFQPGKVTSESMKVPAKQKLLLNASTLKVSSKGSNLSKARHRDHDVSSDSDVPLAKRRKVMALVDDSNLNIEPTESIKSIFEHKLYVPDYKICSRFSEDKWINTFKQASKVMKLADKFKT